MAASPHRYQRPSLLGLLLLIVQAFNFAYAYPVIFELDSRESHCYGINIPDDDDVTLVFISVPGDVDDKVESWLVHEMAEMTRHDSIQFMKDMARAPPDIAELMKPKRGSNNISKMSVTVSQSGSNNRKPLQTTSLKPYIPHSMKNIAKEIQKQRWNPDYGGYSVCLNSRAGRGETIRVLFDFVIMSQYEEKMKKRHLVKKDHLSPLEQKFDESIVLAKSVINEMFYMERREKRMKHTTDGTNSRIRYFSYISVCILCGVTWMQITYLKGYFKKKKVL